MTDPGVMYATNAPLAGLLAISQMVDRVRSDTVPLTIGGSKPVSNVKVQGIASGAPRLVTYSQGTIRKHTGAVGRNDPCPCGSKKKYKKCCGRSEQERVPARPRIPVNSDVRMPADVGPDDELVTHEEVSTGEVKFDIFAQLHQMIVAECPEGVYAYLETGLIIPDASRPNFSSRELLAYDAALRRWHAMTSEEHAQQLSDWPRYCAEPTTFADRPKPQESHDAAAISPS